jgi:hypothetical protein
VSICEPAEPAGDETLVPGSAISNGFCSVKESFCESSEIDEDGLLTAAVNMDNGMVSGVNPGVISGVTRCDLCDSNPCVSNCESTLPVEDEGNTEIPEGEPAEVFEAGMDPVLGGR